MLSVCSTNTNRLYDFTDWTDDLSLQLQRLCKKSILLHGLLWFQDPEAPIHRFPIFVHIYRTLQELLCDLSEWTMVYHVTILFYIINFNAPFVFSVVCVLLHVLALASIPRTKAKKTASKATACLKHLWGYAILRVGNLTKEKSLVFNEIFAMAILVPTLCWK
jgi:hypothetical protein